MKHDSRGDLTIGKYSGVIAERYRASDLLSRLVNITEVLAEPECETISSGRNRNIRVSLSCHGNPITLSVKCFGHQTFLKDWADRVRGSKARRTWLAASVLCQRGVGTPPPVGFLEYWQGGRLKECYYLVEYELDITSFTNELIRLLREDPKCEKIMLLMQCVADAVHAMHEAGFQHNDLGNQNILLRRKGDTEWGDVKFIDLNRTRVKGRLSLRERARDISRIYLPSDFLRVFKEMYYGDIPPPLEFQQWEKFYRRLYALHSRTRKLRHPLRTFRNSEKERRKISYPSEKDIWVWDDRSAQAISTMRSKDRSRFYPLSRHLRIAGATLSGLVPVWREYKSLLKTCYKAPVSLKNRVGVSISPKPETMDRELMLLEKLGKIPVLLRFYCHDVEKQRDFSAGVVRDLHRNGYPVSIALVQDRRAVKDPDRWTSFASYVLNKVSGCVEWVEVGHAINRVKWGVWDFDEHRRLLQGIAGLRGRWPGMKFMGPAVIDFEYSFLMAALKNVPELLHFEALSHHLYVDRRGAPENRQGGFSALEKFALARAIARWAPGCDDRLIVSEVNWPLKGTGVYSPVTSPYESPGMRFNDPSVTEDEYADYMLRYLVIALCSGMVDRVYWWRLVARGFGLVDDTDPAVWRERPAYAILKYFFSVLGESMFLEVRDPAVGGINQSGSRRTPQAGSEVSKEKRGVYLFMFKRPTGEKVCLAYSSGGDMEFDVPFDYSCVTDATGKTLEIRRGSIILSRRPVYVFLR